MRAFDASSMIYAWDNYPAEQFPGLWDWVSDQIKRRNIVLPTIALEEVKRKTPDCAEWLEKKGIVELEVNDDIVQDAAQTKKVLGIVGDKYHPRGVDENDLFIIATARHHNCELVSNESRQKSPPKNLAQMKIPAVCDMDGVKIPCINFIELLKLSKAVFR